MSSSDARDADPKPFEHKPLAGLAGLRARLPDAARSEREPMAAAEPAAADAPADLGAKLVVQRERKKRGGKTVTRIRGLEVGDEQRARLARELKRALGCGASLDGGEILVQGAQVERVAEWLERQSGRRVVRGN